MAELTDECRMVSLRDIERCLKTVMWFYQQRNKLFKEIDKIRGIKGGIDDDLVRSLILAVAVCYMASLEHRNEYLKQVSEAFSLSCSDILAEIEFCKDAFISNIDCPASVAKNEALKENVFMMVVCMNLRIPLFLVGKPGSSKSLSKTIAAHAMQGKASPKDLFKGYKQAQLASFQCSPHSSPDGIISIFRQCAQFQKDKNLTEYVAVVVLDEIGLAEDSPKMPLKTLHPLLEYGCVDDESPDEFKKVGFIGISNWSLDPAKMNRGILVLRTSPETKELENTARDICSSDKKPVNTEIICLIPKLTQFYLKVLEEQKSEFFGLRDFYSLVKLLMSYAIKANGSPSDEDLTRAVQRNFDGLDSLNVLKIFSTFFKSRTKKCDTVSLLRENLDIETSGFTSRYLLLPTINHAALQILKSQNIIDESNVEIIFGSGFPHDEEYSQVCRTVNRVKTCMETGRSVILLNIQSLYESLYDALNQCYVKLGGSYYVDLGLGSHRVKCRVKDEFRLIVIEEKRTVYEQFPTPLLNRLEKHCLEMSNILPDYAQDMKTDLEHWLNKFVTQDSNESEQLITTRKKYDSIVGYTEDTCASILLECCPQILSQELDQDERKEVLEMAQEMLLQCATPDSVLRATNYMEESSERFLEVYFAKQSHGNLIEALRKYKETETNGVCLEISTYSRLLNKRDVDKINKELDIAESDSCLFLLNEFYTEQSFSQTVSEFLASDAGARKLLLLQSYFNDPKQSQRLLFCVRHSISRIKHSVSHGSAFDVVLLTRLPRISGGCGYIATFGDGWVSLHMDELIVTPGFPGDIYDLQKCMTVSETLAKCSISTADNPDMDSSKTPFPEKQHVLVDTHLLMKKSLQKGIMQLRDKADNTQRATKRIEFLHGLLQNKYTVSGAFIKSLERRIVSFLSELEKQKGKENWVVAQALSDRFVAEGSSFRHVLWVHLEDSIALALAHILAVIDGDNNLDNLINDQLQEKADFWLNVFQEDQWDLLHIPVTTAAPDAPTPPPSPENPSVRGNPERSEEHGEATRGGSEEQGEASGGSEEHGEVSGGAKSKARQMGGTTGTTVRPEGPKRCPQPSRSVKRHPPPSRGAERRLPPSSRTERRPPPSSSTERRPLTRSRDERRPQPSWAEDPHWEGGREVWPAISSADEERGGASPGEDEDEGLIGSILRRRNYHGQVSVLSTSGDQTKSWTCHFPFSWALKERFEEVWSCVINLEGPSVKPSKRHFEKFEELIPLPWIKSITQGHKLFALFSEDLVNISMPLYPHELNKAFSDTLTRLTPRVYHKLKENDPDSVPLPWLYVVNKYMHDNHQLLYSLFSQNKDVVTAGEATEALSLVLQDLQPKESELKDFVSCQDWLKKVKSLSVTVDLILSEDSLVTLYAENAEMLITKIRLIWQSTWIIYLLMDHLLQNEQEMEKKLLTFLIRNLLFAWKKLNSEEGKQMEFVIDNVIATLTKCSKNACNVFKVVCGYCDKDFTEDDTTEVECGHMFHISCLKSHEDTHCRKCKKQINQDYKPCGVVAKETFLKVNRFRRKCNSFFVEFMWNFVSSKKQLTDNVLNKLMDYVSCSPSTEATNERSTLQQYMNPDPAVQSLILKILLKCGHFLHLFQGDSEAFLGQLRDIVSTVCPGFSLVSLPDGACPEHLPRETSRKHPGGPQLAPFNVEEQRLYSEFLSGDRAPYPISKGAPRHLTEKTHFGLLYPGSCPFGHDPNLITIATSIYLFYLSLCYLYGRCVSGIEEILEVFLLLSNNIPSRGQQLSTSTINSVGRELLAPSEVPNGLPEFPRGHPIVLLHGLTKLLPDPRFCFRNHPGCSSLGLSEPETLRPQLQMAASTMEEEKMVHSDSMSPTSLGIWLKLLRRMEETAPQLQRFIEEAVKSNERNANEIYFMVVRSIEDHIHFSSQGCLISKASECLRNCVLNKSDQNRISEDLHTIAKLRFAITVASEAIRSVLSEEVTDDAEECRQLFRILQQLLTDTDNPWLQIFLLRNICETHGFSLVCQLGQSEKFQWTIPSQVLQEQQDISTQSVDQFLVYGQMYEKITADSFRALEEPSHEIAQGDNREFDESGVCFRVCMALAAVRQASQKTASTNSTGSVISKMRMKNADPSWGQLVKICESEMEDCSLSQIILHTALVAQVSAAPEMKLLNTLCFSPGKCKDSFIPTMPNSVNEIKDWIKSWTEDAKKSAAQAENLKIWVCRCGEPVLIGNCGRPYVKSVCANCGSEVGGEGHTPVEGFKEFNNSQGSGRGHNLGDPSSRKEQVGERSLYGANLHLVRALIHSSMIWGTTEHTEEVQNLTEMPQGAHDVRKHLLDHLQKDIELLAQALGKSEQDAEMTVHLFLKFILESSSELNIQIQITDSEEKREEWEKVIHQSLQAFFQNLEAELLEVQSNMLRFAGMGTLQKMIYSKEPALKDLPTSGAFNIPLMWSFTQRMTIQRLGHLIELKDERTNVHLLSELLKSRKPPPLQVFLHLLPAPTTDQDSYLTSSDN
ncbi:hypothetical protein QTP86_034163 [Hemibagrus guttatus]|nr:hypothetical protein QTP86_034163 [Hemibagrus guttatus]